MYLKVLSATLAQKTTQTIDSIFNKVFYNPDGSLRKYSVTEETILKIIATQPNTSFEFLQTQYPNSPFILDGAKSFAALKEFMLKLKNTDFPLLVLGSQQQQKVFIQNENIYIPMGIFELGFLENHQYLVDKLRDRKFQETLKDNLWYFSVPLSDHKLLDKLINSIKSEYAKTVLTQIRQNIQDRTFTELALPSLLNNFNNEVCPLDLLLNSVLSFKQKYDIQLPVILEAQDKTEALFLQKYLDQYWKQLSVKYTILLPGQTVTPTAEQQSLITLNPSSLLNLYNFSSLKQIYLLARYNQEYSGAFSLYSDNTPESPAILTIAPLSANKPTQKISLDYTWLGNATRVGSLPSNVFGEFFCKYLKAFPEFIIEGDNHKILIAGKNYTNEADLERMFRSPVNNNLIKLAPRSNFIVNNVQIFLAAQGAIVVGENASFIANTEHPSDQAYYRLLNYTLNILPGLNHIVTMGNQSGLDLQHDNWVENIVTGEHNWEAGTVSIETKQIIHDAPIPILPRSLHLPPGKVISAKKVDSIVKTLNNVFNSPFFKHRKLWIVDDQEPKTTEDQERMLEQFVKKEIQVKSTRYYYPELLKFLDNHPSIFSYTKTPDKSAILIKFTAEQLTSDAFMSLTTQANLCDDTVSTLCDLYKGYNLARTTKSEILHYVKNIKSVSAKVSVANQISELLAITDKSTVGIIVLDNNFDFEQEKNIRHEATKEIDDILNAFPGIPVIFFTSEEIPLDDYLSISGKNHGHIQFVRKNPWNSSFNRGKNNLSSNISERTQLKYSKLFDNYNNLSLIEAISQAFYYIEGRTSH